MKRVEVASDTGMKIKEQYLAGCKSALTFGSSKSLSTHHATHTDNMCHFKLITGSLYVPYFFLYSSKTFPRCFHRDVTLQNGRDVGARILLR